MNLLTLSLRYLRARSLTNLLLIILLAMGVASISLLMHISHQSQQRLEADGKGFDLVIGAKGSPLQLILSSIYHLDIPTGNIALESAQRWMRHPSVRQAIPLALGDSHRGFRIIGTTPDYISHYKAEFQDGGVFNAPMQAVLGSRVAQETGLKKDGHFTGSHGLSSDGEEHADSPYTVAGILNPTGTVLDRLILTQVESVWQVHGMEAHHHHDAKDEAHHAHHHDEHDHEEHAGEKADAEKDITALLISYRSPVAAMSMPREVNRTSELQAASPAFETARLFSLLGLGLDSLRVFAMILTVSAVIGMLVALYQTLHERRYDLALMRVMGASPMKLAGLLVCEVGILLVAGIGLGLTLSHTALFALPELIPALRDLGLSPLYFLSHELVFAGVLLGSGLFISLLPAYSSYQMDASRILAKG